MSALCDSLVALEAGRVIATGSPAEVLGHRAVIDYWLGSDSTVVARSGPRTADRGTTLTSARGPVTFLD